MGFFNRIQNTEDRIQESGVRGQGSEKWICTRWQAVAGMACVIGFVAGVIFLLVVMARGVATVLF